MMAVRPRRHPLLRLRYQLLGGLAFAILFPMSLRIYPDVSMLRADGTLQNTILAATCAHLSGFLAYRRIASVPGVAAAGNIIPTFAICYGLVFVAIYFLGVDYSRFQAAASFSLSTLWYFGLHLATRRIARHRLAVIPGTDFAGLHGIDGVRWQRLSVPVQTIGDVTGIVADLRADLGEDWVRFITDCTLRGTPVYHVKQVVESLTGRVEIEHLSENTLGSLNPNDIYIKFKEIADWTAALLVLLLLSPLLAVVAIAIKIDTPGPVLFRQARVGYRGRTFTVYKFRSMKFGGATNDDEIHQAKTLPGDVRVTRVGRFIRRTRIDELPQVLNILRGEMSWIGPRPEALVLSNWYAAELPFYRYRHIVRPSITGWAQVNQGHVAEVDDVLEKLHYDFYYIKNFSPWLDLVIILRTIHTVFTGHGAK